MTTDDSAPSDYADLRADAGLHPAVASKLAGFATFVMLLFALAVCRHDCNLHTVEPGQLYRSGELDAATLEAAIANDGIKSVINLEGARPGRDWYDSELMIAQQHRIVHYDFPMQATRLPSPAQIEALIDLMRSAPKPMLIHCRSGADRAGLAAALYLARLRHSDAESARAQLSWRYGHFPYLGSPTRAMDEAFETAQVP